MSGSVIDLLQQPDNYVKVCAPMVRYSKLNFRTLVRKYNVNLCFTPMIIADSFIKSSKARNNEFSTNDNDTPLIVQFAANNCQDFVKASEYVFPFSNGVDLNCGCPQRWAIKDGYGCALLSKPDIIASCIRELRNHIPSNDFTVSVKVRLLNSLEKSVQFCQVLEKCGVSFLTVHARTAQQKHEPIDMESLKILKETLCIPIIANGDVRTLQDADDLFFHTRCNGIMSARGILKNPTLFSGMHHTPLSCIEDWINMKHSHFMTFQHHLMFMCDRLLSSQEKERLNNLVDGTSVLDFLELKFNIKSQCRSSFLSLNKGYTVEEEGKFFKEEITAQKSKKNQENQSEEILEHFTCIFDC